MTMGHYMKLALYALRDASRNLISQAQVDKAGDTIVACAIAAAIAGVGSGWLPGAGALVATAAWVAAIWTMYVKINKDLGISISENILKSLASAFLTNIIASAGALILAILASFALSFIPFLGQAGAIAIDGLLGYITVFASGILYIMLLTKIMKAKGSFDISESEAKSMADNISKESDISAIIREAKESFKKEKDKGTFKK
jgi:hypothetical protein